MFSGIGIVTGETSNQPSTRNGREGDSTEDAEVSEISYLIATL